jgi:hypothetical protein
VGPAQSAILQSDTKAKLEEAERKMVRSLTVMDAFLRSQGSDDGGDFFLGKQYRWGGGGSRAAQLGVAVQRGAAPASAEHEMCLLGALHPGACPHTTLSRAPSAWQLAPLAGPDRRPAPHPPPPPTLPCSVAEVLTTSLLQRALVYCKAYRGVDLWRLVADAKLARLEAWMKAAMERPSAKETMPDHDELVAHGKKFTVPMQEG